MKFKKQIINLKKKQFEKKIKGNAKTKHTNNKKEKIKHIIKSFITHKKAM